jgi:hypothetical protein
MLIMPVGYGLNGKKHAVLIGRKTPVAIVSYSDLPMIAVNAC